MREISSPSRLRRFLLACALACAAASFLPGRAWAQSADTLPGSLNFTDKGLGEMAYSWGTVPAPTTPTGCTSNGTKVTYTLCLRRVVFNKGMSGDQDGLGSFTGGTCEKIATTAGNSWGPVSWGDGSLCADVGGVATNVTTCGNLTNVDYSGATCHSFVHAAPNGTNNLFVLLPIISRADAQGGQLGFGEQWTFTYALDNDASTTMKVFGPGVTFPAADATQNFTAEPAFSVAHPGCTYSPSPAVDVFDAVLNHASGPDCPVKVLVDGTARPGEGSGASGGTSNTETWDLHDSTGNVVPNGTYSLWGKFIDVQDNSAFTNDQAGGHLQCPPNCPSTTIGFSGYLTDIPVDVLRFLNFKTNGITPATNTNLATVGYQITGAATVNIVIAQPGRLFTIDALGLVHSLDPTGHVIDDSTNSVVAKFQFNRLPGTYSETWNGSNTLGVFVSSGLYAVGLSAVDAFGNQALNLSGNNGALVGTIPVDRTSGETGGNTSPPVITGISAGVTPISLTGGTSVSPFNTVTFTLNTGAGTGSNLSIVSVSTSQTAPPIAGSTVTAIGNTVTWAVANTISSTGSYTASIVAIDSFGNRSAPQSYQFNIPTPVPPTMTSIQVGPQTIALAGGSQVAPWQNVVFNLNLTTGASVSAAATKIYLSSSPSAFGAENPISLSLLTANQNAISFSTGNVMTFGTYIGSITAVDSLGNVGTPFPFSFTVPKTPAPQVSAITVGSVNINPSGGTAVSPFTVISFALNTFQGSVASNNTAVSLNLNSGGALIGVPGVVGSGSNANTINFTIPATEASTGTYTGTINPVDSFGDTGTPVPFSFTITPPSVSTITVGSTAISQTGGTSVQPFSTISFGLNTYGGASAGQNVFISSTVLIFGGVDLKAAASASGNLVTLSTNTTLSSTGTYTVKIIPEDSNGITGSTVTTTFVIPTAPPPQITQISVGGTAISLTGGSQVAAFSNISYAFSSTPGTGLNISSVTLTYKGVSLSGFVSVSGSNVVFTPTAQVTSSGTYTTTILAKDINGNAAAPLTTTFIIPSPAPPQIVSAVVGNLPISLQGGTQVQPFSSIAFTLNEAAGTGVNLSSMTLVFNGVDLKGSISVSGSVVTLSTNTTYSSTGVYTATIVARDPNGVTAAPFTVSFTLPSQPPQSGPSVTAVTVGGTGIALVGGSQVAPFSSIVFSLNGPAGTGVNTSSVTLVFNGQNVPGFVSVNGSAVTFTPSVTASSSGTYTATIIPKDFNGNAALPFAVNFLIPPPQPPQVTAASVGSAAISLLGGSQASPFGTISFTLSSVAGSGVYLSSVTLFYGGLNLGGQITASGNTVTYSTNTILTSSGTYAVSIVPEDLNGVTGAPLSINFVLPVPPAPQVLSITVGGTPVALSGGSQVPTYTAITYALNTTAGTGVNISSVTLFYNGVSLPGFVSVSGNNVTFTPAAAVTSSGTYTTTIQAKDFNGNPAAPVTVSFLIPNPPPPQVLSATVGALPISLQGGSQASPFSSVAFTLNTNAGTGVNLSSVTLVFNGRDLGGAISVAANVVTLSTNTTLSSSGTYTATIIAKDVNGVVAAPLVVTFALPAPPPQAGPQVTSVVVGGTGIALGGGTQVSAFSNIVFSLNTQAGTGVNTSSVTLMFNGASLLGFVSVAGNAVTFTPTLVAGSSGTYTTTIIPKDFNGNASLPFSVNFIIPSPPPPQISSASVNGTGITLVGATQVVGPLSTVQIGINTTAGTGLYLSSVTLVHNGASIPGTVSSAGKTISFTPTAPVLSSGTFSAIVIATDFNGVTAAPVTINFVVTAAPVAGPAPQSPDAFKASITPFPNPARNGQPIAIQFNLAGPSSMDIDIFTLMGQRVFHQTQSFPAGTQSFPWQLNNDGGSAVASGIYIVRMTAHTGGQVIKATKKVMVLK